MQHTYKAIGLGVLFAGLAGLMSLAGPPPAEAGMGPGMMGSGMMMSPDGGAQELVSHAGADALVGYIHENNLGCLQCHAVSGRGFGPSFSAIATNAARQDNAQQMLSRHIAHGIGRMPAGLASDEQARRLARLILDMQHHR